MKNKDCNIIQDLLPNYIENLTSENTNKFIEEHVDGCKTCSEILENMKTEIKEEPKVEKREVKYAKKIALKLKILRVFIILIIVAILVFVANTTRKYLILRKLDEISKTYVNSKSENYRLLSVSSDISSAKTVNLWEFNRFKNKELDIMVYYAMDVNQSSITKSITYHGDSERIYVMEKNGEIVDGYIIKNIKYDFDFPITFSTEKEDLKGFKGLRNIIISNITEEEFDGTMCYVISLFDTKNYYEKNTGLLRKIIDNSGYVTEYYYDFNCLNDDMVKKPDTSGITLKETDYLEGGGDYE